MFQPTAMRRGVAKLAACNGGSRRRYTLSKRIVLERPAISLSDRTSESVRDAEGELMPCLQIHAGSDISRGL